MGRKYAEDDANRYVTKKEWAEKVGSRPGPEVPVVAKSDWEAAFPGVKHPDKRADPVYCLPDGAGETGDDLRLRVEELEQWAGDVRDELGRMGRELSSRASAGEQARSAVMAALGMAREGDEFLGLVSDRLLAMSMDEVSNDDA